MTPPPASCPIHNTPAQHGASPPHPTTRYGPEDEGAEWRRVPKYEGLKRQRKSVEHYQPEGGGLQRSSRGDGISTQVGPFRHSDKLSGGGSSRSHGGSSFRFGSRRGHVGRRGDDGSDRESSTLSSEGEFEKRMRKSESRLRDSMGALNQNHLGPQPHQPNGARPNALPIRSAGGRALPQPASAAAMLGGAGGAGGAATAGDVQRLAIDETVGWEKVGGLKSHVEALKEVVLLPLMYPEVFETLGVAPPKGVLFHGPPGTGKTLVARALANTCSSAGRPVAFFMRKGADVLSKWVGEAEKQLRLLFTEAFRQQPSIIFFDEIDGLAPVRSSKQDQIHSSIVATLLALMDGVDSRGQVILIGATNRIDSLDPALRRPGRFDRELQFSLPSMTARREILQIHTQTWGACCPPAARLDELASRTHGFCGADLRALCSEAALRALRETYPEIFTSTDK